MAWKILESDVVIDMGNIWKIQSGIVLNDEFLLQKASRLCGSVLFMLVNVLQVKVSCTLQWFLVLNWWDGFSKM